MAIYWFLFFIPAYFLLAKSDGGANSPRLVWRLFGLFLIFLIGLRYQVGGDWGNYLEGLELLKGSSWADIFEMKKEAGYTLVSLLSLALGADIYGVNLVCAAIFTGGLLNLSRAQPYPWIAIVAAIPYLVIVVAMGYTRQAVAIGLLMYGLGFLLRGRVVMYLILVVLAGLFHKTAFVFAAFAMFRPGSGLFRRVLGAGLLVGLSGSAFLVEQAEFLMLHYVEQTMESSGGQIRVFMNALPALVLFIYWKRWGEKFEDRWLWGLVAVLAIVCVPLVSMASTAVDRMALYLIPLQLVVWARFPVLVQGRIPRILAYLMIIGLYATTQFVWLVFGTHAPYWVPYDNLLFPA